MTISTSRVSHAGRKTMDSAVRPSLEIVLTGREDVRAREIEHFIRCIFRRAYGARIGSFPPCLLGIRQNESIMAALGLRAAAVTRLFLETYLEHPVENRLAGTLSRPIDRSRIVEVTNLASSHSGGARALIITLTAYLHSANCDWAVFTATPGLLNNFTRLGIEITPLMQADKRLLGDAQHDWGSYYDQHPVVVACHVGQSAAAILSSLKGQHLIPFAQHLWDEATIAGRHSVLKQPPHKLTAFIPEWAPSVHAKAAFKIEQ